MKKKMAKLMALGMLMTAMVNTGALADEVNQEKIILISKKTPEADKNGYLTQKGVISMVETDDEPGNILVTIDNETGGLRFSVAPNTIIVNREDATYMRGDMLKEGMSVAVIYDMNSPMGLSMPAYLGNVTAVVANSDTGLIAVGDFDENLTDMNNMLKLDIHKDTIIQSITGTKNLMTAEDIAGNKALVFYDGTTKSIPARTTPTFVLLLTRSEEERDVATDIPLRAEAEARGFTVIWQGKEKPILVEKGDMKLSFELDSWFYTLNGEEIKLSAPTELRDGRTFVAAEVFK